MISDPDIFRAAQVLMKRYGEGAALEAVQRVDAMLERDDMEGAAVCGGSSRRRRNCSEPGPA